MRSIPVLALAVAAPAAAAGTDTNRHEEPPPPATPRALAPIIHAARTQRPPAIDGRLDDPAWADAPPFTAFELNQPTEGGPGSERTELRVLFDDDRLYVAFRCSDSQPATIVGSLARRDSEPASDYVAVFIDAGDDGRTARRFFLNAAGVQADSLIYDDVQQSQSWDAVWDGAATVTDDGWTAELEIPLHVLGIDAQRARWGFLARRYIARTHELVSAPLVPRAANGLVSYFGAVDGVAAVAPRPALEIVPYIAARTLVEKGGSADLGADLALYPGLGLLLNATLNPDFGEVQPDAIILNVSSFETFYPELRPFFTQGMDAFLTVGGQDTLQSMFYSRRIGAQAPILGAGKLTGRPIPGLTIGLLDAFVDGRPLHVGSSDGDTGDGENFIAATARATLAGSSWVGARFSAATPLGDKVAGVNAAGVDANLKSGDYGLFGQAAVTESVKGPPRITRDGTRIAAGDLGVGGFVRAGKLGGEGFRLQLGYDYAAPSFDLNAVGFQRDANLHDGHLDVGVSYPNGVGPLLSLDAWFHGELEFSADGRGLRRIGSTGIEVNALLPGFHKLSLIGQTNRPGWDIRELAGSGVALDSAPIAYGRLTFDSDANQPLAAHAMVALGWHDAIGPTPQRYDWTFEAGGTWRPMPALQTQLTATLDRTLFDPRFVAREDDGSFLLGRLDATTLTITLRQDWAITRRLTLQAYLQLFSAYGSYGPFYLGQGTPEQPLRQDEIMPAPPPGPDPSFHAAELVANLVGRWEYRPGSTLFLVYSRTQKEQPPDMPDGAIGVSRLFAGPATDLVLVKWAQWLAF